MGVKRERFEKNRIVTVKIEDMGNEGQGIGKAEGFTLFVKDAVAGDTVEARILKCKKNYAYARLEKVLVPSPFRVEPACLYHRQCGGCQLQALSYEKQLAFKQERIRNSLIRIGGFAPEAVDGKMEPVVGMGEPGAEMLFRYRNKALYPVGTDREGNVVTGFYAGRTHTIIPNTNCLLGVEENEEILNGVLDYMKENRVSAYDEVSGTGLVRHVLIRKGFASGEIMVCLVVNPEEGNSAGKNSAGRAAGGGQRGEYLPEQEKLVARLRHIAGMTSVSVSINRSRTNVIMGEEIHFIWGREWISDSICMRDMKTPGYPRTGKSLTFRISPLSFYQVNPVQTEKLYSLVLEFAGLTGKETVWDLYCGIGTISLFLAGSARKVWGVEAVPEAVRDARENAERNHIRNAEFFVGKAEDVLEGFYGKNKEAEDFSGQSDDLSEQYNMMHPDVIVVDPPRKGCDQACLDTMLKMAPRRIVYVSCDPATLARDLRILCDGGYELERVRGTDMFGMTVHVETVCLLSKLNAKQHIEVEVKMDELDLTAAESKATYEEIKAYVLEHSGIKVSSLYIAQVKQKCGIIKRENYNKPKSEDTKQPQCPPDKEKAIMEALKHFGMI